MLEPNEIYLGNYDCKLCFEVSDEDDYNPTISFYKDTFFGQKKFELNEWQKQNLFNNVTRYLKSLINIKNKEIIKLKGQLKELDKVKSEVEKKLAKARTIV